MSKPEPRDFRPRFHFTPEKGWINDPNGLVYENGRWHLFAQYYPDTPVWGPMHWYHAVSGDLLHWRPLPVALAPDELGYMFSGSAVYDRENSSGFGSKERPPMVLMYTAHGEHEQQCLAYSTDYVNFTKYEGNPVLPNDGLRDFRDPKLFPHPEGGWGLVLAAGDRVHFYRSVNLKEWEKTGEFGPEGNRSPGVWECPDLFPLRADGRELWVLLLSMGPNEENRGSRTQYFIGSFDGKTFRPDRLFDRPQFIDEGLEDYAGVTYHNTTERLFMGWASNWPYADALPTGESRGCFTLPRLLSLRETPLGGLRLAAQPAAWPLAREVPAAEGLPGECFAVLAKGNGPAVFHLENDEGHRLSFGVNDRNEFFVDRSAAGRTDFHESFGSEEYSRMAAPRFYEGPWELKLYFDRSVAELYGDGGLRVFTALVFPEEPYTRLTTPASAEVRVFATE